MAIYRTVLLMEVSDFSAVEAAANTILTEQGKTSSERQEILYDGNEFQIVNALAQLYSPRVLYSGTSLDGVEVYKDGDQ